MSLSICCGSRGAWFLLLLASGCAAGAPVGFSEGKQWSMPCIGGLNGDIPVAPVYLNGKGPYLFQVVPRMATAIDPRLVKEIGAFTERRAARYISASDTISRDVLDIAQIDQLKVGTLSVRGLQVAVLPSSATFHEWPILGVLGREIFADSLVWSFDLDRQMIHLATQEAAAPPADAMAIKADRIDNDRFFVDASVGNQQAYVWIDFNLPMSTAWPQAVAKLGLERGQPVSIGGAPVGEVQFQPFRDRRDRHTDYDGRIGRDVLARFNFTVNWHQKRIWLGRRDGDLQTSAVARIARWGGSLAKCSQPGCVSARVETDGSNAPSVVVEREAHVADLSYDVLLQPMGPDGKPLPLVNLLVAFPRGAARASATGPSAARYAAVSEFRAIDVTPFPPASCTGSNGCIWLSR